MGIRISSRRKISLSKRLANLPTVQQKAKGWDFPLDELDISQVAKEALSRLGYTTAASIREDMMWYDDPQLNNEVDSIMAATKIRPGMISNRFATR